MSKEETKNAIQQEKEFSEVQNIIKYCISNELGFRDTGKELGTRINVYTKQIIDWHNSQSRNAVINEVLELVCTAIGEVTSLHDLKVIRNMGMRIEALKTSNKDGDKAGTP